MVITCSPQEEKILRHVAQTAENMKMPAYLVGGFVRDKLIGRVTKDIDIVCLGDGIEFADALSRTFRPFPEVHVFKNFGTAQIRLQDIELEVVGARKESYRSDSRKPQVSPGSLQDDQNRRDLTINALAISLNKDDYGQLLDPFDGLMDLEKKILRTPLPPDQTFQDDPLRMMRTIRFACQLDYHIEKDTLDAIQRNAERLKIVSKERIVDELNKIIACKKPSKGFYLLEKTGLLPLFFPEFSALAGAIFIDGKGHKDNFQHTLQVLDNLCLHTDKLYLRWAAILHDIGKPATRQFEQGHGWTFHGHEWVGAKMVPSIFSRLRLPQHEPMKYVQKLVALHLRPISLTKEDITDSAIRRLLVDAGDDIDDLMLLCDADITSKNEQKVRRFRENFQEVKKRMAEVEARDQLRNWQPPISGEIIMQTFNLPPCKLVGDLKLAVREAILDGVIPNDYEPAFAFMLEKAKELNLQPIS